MRYARSGGRYFASADGHTWTPVPLDGGAPISALIAAARDFDPSPSSESLPLATETLQCPVVEPSKIVAVGLNYRDHIAELGIEAPPRPNLFAKLPNSLNDPTGDIVMVPELSEKLDYEAELAVVIASDTYRVPASEAHRHVFAFCVANDVSARDLQVEDVQVCRAKSQDTFCPLGPYLTEVNDLREPDALRVRTWVDGEIRQDSTTASLVFDVSHLIEFISAGITLRAGDVILTGTPAGVGFTKTPPRYLSPGAVVRCEIDGLGAIENRVVTRGDRDTPVAGDDR